MPADTEYKYQINTGGLMRCCIASIEDYETENVELSKQDPNTEVKLNCKYCLDKIIRQDGVWRWDRD